MRRTRLAGLLVSALLVSACGAGSAAGTGPTASTPPAAPSPTSSAGAEDGAALEARVVAALRQAGTAQLSMVTTGPDGTVSAVGAIRFGASTDLSVRVRSGTTTTEVVVLGPAVYVRSRSLPTRRWVRVPAGAADPLSQSLAPVLEPVRRNTSVEVLLRGWAGAPVTSTGTRPGAPPVTEYVYALDGPALASTLPEGLRARVGAGATGTALLSVDDQDRVGGLLVDADLPGGTVRTSLRYVAWGAPVTIEAPPAADVVDAAEVS